MSTETTFTVKGRGRFPIDMLRYDSAYPARQEDAAAIQNSIETWTRDPWEVALITSLPHTPTFDRWSSFMVKVTCVNGRRVE